MPVDYSGMLTHPAMYGGGRSIADALGIITQNYQTYSQQKIANLLQLYQTAGSKAVNPMLQSPEIRRAARWAGFPLPAGGFPMTPQEARSEFGKLLEGIQPQATTATVDIPTGQWTVKYGAKPKASKVTEGGAPQAQAPTLPVGGPQAGPRGLAELTAPGGPTSIGKALGGGIEFTTPGGAVPEQVSESIPVSYERFARVDPSTIPGLRQAAAIAGISQAEVEQAANPWYRPQTIQEGIALAGLGLSYQELKQRGDQATAALAQAKAEGADRVKIAKLTAIVSIIDQLGTAVRTYGSTNTEALAPFVNQVAPIYNKLVEDPDLRDLGLTPLKMNLPAKPVGPTALGVEAARTAAGVTTAGMEIQGRKETAIISAAADRYATDATNANRLALQDMQGKQGLALAEATARYGQQFGRWNPATTGDRRLDLAIRMTTQQIGPAPMNQMQMSLMKLSGTPEQQTEGYNELATMERIRTDNYARLLEVNMKKTGYDPVKAEIDRLYKKVLVAGAQWSPRRKAVLKSQYGLMLAADRADETKIDALIARVKAAKE